MADNEDKIYQGYEFTDEEVVTAFANAILSDNFDQYDKVYEANEELDMEVQLRINFDIEYKLRSDNNFSSFLTEATDTTMEESPSIFPSEQPKTVSLE